MPNSPVTATYKVPGLKTRRERWTRKACRAVHAVYAPLLVAWLMIPIGIQVLSGLWLTPAPLAESGLLPFIGRLGYFECLLLSLPAMLLLLGSLVLTLAGPFPTQSALEHERTLRRAYGLSDELES